ncbi:methyltransferase [Streptomyces sp. TRM64462]|uniref:methyltransferase n=1 Tax=Streptomyces sp. TRM64462 TaxID=2741726 RepID=UPI001C2F1AE7|nr:methyltransferase [Streptomyces sp. TRM64462]
MAPLDLQLGQISQLAFGYWHAQVLFSATGLGVFDALADGPLPGDAVAERCGLPAEPCRRLLDAATALRLLVRDQATGEYGNTPAAQRLLTSASPESLTPWVKVMGRWYGPWGDLGEALRLGRAVEHRGSRLGDDPAYAEDFILGMHAYNSRTAQALADALPEPGPGPLRIADVGGGAGTYSIALCKAWGEARAEVVDLAAVLPIAEATVAGAGLADRITVREGDYYRDSFGADLDVVLLSNVLHQESRENGLDILRRARAALRPGGRVLVHGHFLEESRTAPAFTTLHNLSALVLWSGGRSYTAAEMAELMADAGFADVDVRRTPEPSARLLVGHRAADTR